MKELLKSTDSEDRLFSNLAATWSSGAMFTPDSHIKILRSHVDEQTADLRTALEAERAKVVEHENTIEMLKFHETSLLETLDELRPQLGEMQRERDSLAVQVVELKNLLTLFLGNRKQLIGEACFFATPEFEKRVWDVLAKPSASPGESYRGKMVVERGELATLHSLQVALEQNTQALRDQEQVYMELDELRRSNEELSSELTALRSSQEWRSIETAPLMQDVLVSLDTGGVAVHRKSAHGTWSCWGESSSPTAWLPLPHAGKEKGT